MARAARGGAISIKLGHPADPQLLLSVRVAAARAPGTLAEIEVATHPQVRHSGNSEPHFYKPLLIEFVVNL